MSAPSIDMGRRVSGLALLSAIVFAACSTSDGPACTALSNCCSQITNDTNREDCQIVAGGGYDPDCAYFMCDQVDIASLCDFSCGSTGPGESGGEGTPDGGAGEGSCATLLQCCPNLPASEIAACEEISSADDSSSCSAQLAMLGSTCM